MEMSQLGKTGLCVSRLGAGLVEIGGFSMDEAQKAGRVLGAALDAGINFLDTAECYANSEELIGMTIAHRRQEFVLATKAGHVPTGSSGQPWTGETVRQGIDQSLKKLRTDCVDHEPGTYWNRDPSKNRPQTRSCWPWGLSSRTRQSTPPSWIGAESTDLYGSGSISFRPMPVENLLSVMHRLCFRYLAELPPIEG